MGSGDSKEIWWSGLIEQSRQVDGCHTCLKPKNSNYLEAPSGIPHLYWCYGVFQNECFAELYVARRDPEENKEILERLQRHREDVERTFGGTLFWDRMEGRQNARIRYTLPGGYRSPPEDWASLQCTIVSAMSKLEKSLGPYLGRI
jgi:hypothetical protein